MNERVRRRLELRRSNAARPHRNKARFDKSTRHDWKGLVMWETVESGELKDIVVQREGSSQRTVEELSLRFVRDVLDIAIDTATFSEIKALESLVAEAMESFDSLDAMEDIVHEAESRLSDMGYVVDWNDGYIIFEA